LLESLANTASGFGLSYLTWWAISEPVLHRPFHPNEGLTVVLIFTIQSIARNYVWRRLFNTRARP
jgi:hypothetical protein